MIERSDKNRRFYRHLLEAMGLGSAAGLAITAVACSPNVILDGTGHGGAGAGSTTTTPCSNAHPCGDVSVGTYGNVTVGGYGGYGDTGTGYGGYGDTGTGYGGHGYGGYGYGGYGTGYGGYGAYGGYGGVGGSGVTTAVGAGGSFGVGGGCSVVVPKGDSPAQGCFPSNGNPCPQLGDPSLRPQFAAAIGACDPSAGGCSCTDTQLVDIDCGPSVTQSGACCYYGITNFQGCGTGRPFTVEGQARTAPLRARTDWLAAGLGPDVDTLDAVTRGALAAAWSRDARFEHASVASFARLALELLAVGAPAELVRDAQRAMGDEIRHAELCFALAGAYAGAAEGPGKLPFEGALGRASLVEVAAAAVREGCIGETLAALAMAEARDLAEDPAVRAALDVIAEDEAAHAAMAWRLVAWAHRAGGAEVREAIAAAFAADVDVSDLAGTCEEGVDVDAFHAHGRMLPAEIRAHAERALAEVVRPSAAALMGV